MALERLPVHPQVVPEFLEIRPGNRLEIHPENHLEIPLARQVLQVRPENPEIPRRFQGLEINAYMIAPFNE
ncbi:hypothetical protein J40TS1_29700 [Paenibacillus montaniterrae]|uniref:Uncharacterized protein n=1 Tax=Paenibacillus montaniterrae TaxID=429341 RepID=A0A919YV00_9BACL|nr:hypothetical protein J40TS1_29700 [Paenibacillus montaniterrae]